MSDLSVILSHQALSHSSQWWSLTHKSIPHSQAVDQMSLFTRQFRSLTRVILQFTTRFCKIQPKLSQLTHQPASLAARALESFALSSTQNNQESTTFKLSGSTTIIHQTCKRSTLLVTAMSQLLSSQTIRNFSSLQSSKEFQASSKCSWRMSQEFLCNTSGKSQRNTRMKSSLLQLKLTCFQMKRLRSWLLSQPWRKRTIISLCRSMPVTSMTTRRIQLVSTTQGLETCRRLAHQSNHQTLSSKSTASRFSEEEVMVEFKSHQPMLTLEPSLLDSIRLCKPQSTTGATATFSLS